MKALILAAGFGTRLLPHTRILPKALFPVAGKPLLDLTIEKLYAAGCEAVTVNTHHLHEEIEAHVARRTYPIPVRLSYEPEILGTGGAIQNNAPFWDERPFIVINADVYTDIDLKAVYTFHHHHPYLATLVLFDDPEFNTVCIDRNRFVSGFVRTKDPAPQTATEKRLTFTGIHILDPQILAFLPQKGFAGIIDTYQNLLDSNKRIKAFVAARNTWRDIGTPARYRDLAYEKGAAEAFKCAGIHCDPQKIVCAPIAGDGSDRKWFRLLVAGKSLVMADHGLRIQKGPAEVDSFVAIGRHLHSRGVLVPEIFFAEPQAGLVFLQDLGDTNLHGLVQKSRTPESVVALYKTVIRGLIHMWRAGGDGFDPAWTCQTPYYDADLILERECRYFQTAFLKGYAGLKIEDSMLADDFQFLAQNALQFALPGFMHRDLQSHNIMIFEDRPYFIDFQGGRLGPLQYDLASLLIDPYVDLPNPVQEALLDFCIEELLAAMPLKPAEFIRCYRFCRLTRNLQALGAFGYLSQVKQKTFFETYIPAALRSLKQTLDMLDEKRLSSLKAIVEQIKV